MNREKFLKPFNGNIAEAARQLNLSHTFISKCLRGDKKWPIARLNEMNEQFGIPKYAMRPDIFNVPINVREKQGEH